MGGYRDDWSIEEVDEDFSRRKNLGACPDCNYSICFLPTILSRLTKDCQALVDIGIDLSSWQRVSVKEWECWNCKTYFVNIRIKDFENNPNPMNKINTTKKEE